MKLSEAIRLGAMLRGQAFGHTFGDDASCAWGAAMEAHGVEYRSGTNYRTTPIKLWWPWAFDRHTTQCPSCDTAREWSAGIVTHLNNEHRWTREQIADWVATVEPQETAVPVCAEAEAVPVGAAR